MKKTVAKAGREAERWDGYRLLFEINPQPMFIMDRENMGFLAVNDAAVAQYGWSREELLDMRLPDLWPKTERPRYAQLYASQPETGLREVGLRKHLRKDGTVLTVNVMRHTMVYGGKDAILAVVRDVTDYHNVREALQEKEELFHLMISGIKDYGVIMLDAGGRVLTWNQGAERATGYTNEDVVGRHWSCFFSPEDVRLGKPDAALIIAESKGRYEEEGLRVRKDGTRFQADCMLTALRDSSGKLRGFACISRDVTDKRALEQRILEAAEREQNRIGQDLHDSLGQRLTGIGLLAKALEEQLVSRKGPGAKEATVIRKQLTEAAEETRRLARGLYSADLEANRLIPALRQLLDDSRLLFGVEVELDAEQGFAAPERLVSTQLYHIAQEAIHNAVRHGKARRIRIALESEPAALSLTVKDDGVGIPAELPAGRGMGLRIMGYRAGLIGGQLRVAPHADGGTQVSCRVAAPSKSSTMRPSP